MAGEGEEFLVGDGIPSRTETYSENDFPMPSWDDLIEKFEDEDIDDALVIFIGEIGQT